MFAYNTRTGELTGDLFDLLAAAEAGALIDLPAMQAHQRPGIVTGLAIVMTVLRLYGRRERPWPATVWREEWDRQIGAEARRPVAPCNEVALFQPPVADAKHLKQIDLLSVDAGFVGVQHITKADERAELQAWLLAILSGALRPHANFNPAGSRSLMLCVLPSDGSLGSEICWLAEAYLAEAKPAEGAREHLPWLQALGATAVTPTMLPRPYLDLPRAIRLWPNGTAAYEASNARRIDARNTPLIDDPHVPVELRAGREAQPYRLQGAREWSYVVLHAALAGRSADKSEVRPARILGLIADYPAIRVCALRGEQGKTMGYRERMLAATPRALDFFSLALGGDDRPGELSRAIIATLALGRNKILVPALYALGLEQTEVYARARDFDAEAGMASVQLLLDLLGRDPDPEVEQRAMANLARKGAEYVFVCAADVCADPLRQARAELVLRNAMHVQLPGDERMAKNEIPSLARRVHAVLGDVASHLTPDERAALRTMGSGVPPMCLWAMLAQAPAELTGAGVRDEAWTTIFRAMGRVAPGGGSIGRALADADYPELRMRQLLVATGASLQSLCAEALRWLVARDVARTQLADLLTLMLADSIGEKTTLSWIRRSIAMGYIKAVKVEKAA